MTKTNAPRSRRLVLTLTVAAAVLTTAVLVALSQLGAGGAGKAEELYLGIPQKGTTLGEVDAPVTIYLYEDFQCPFCSRFSRDTFPALVSGPVKEGKVKVISEPLAFLGPDSVRTAKAALAAGEQDLYWPYYSLLFENQGQENSGYATGEFLKGLAEKTPGLDVNRWDARLAKGPFDKELEAARSRAVADEVDSTPTLLVSGPGGKEKLTGLRDYGEISAAIDRSNGS